MAKIKEEDLRLNIIISGDKASMKRLQGDLSLTGMTLTELRKHLSQTKKALSSAVPGTENWKRLQKEVKATQARLDELNGKVRKTKSALTGLLKGGAIVSGVRMAARAVSSLTEKIAGFEQANANLASVLGKSVNDIKDLTDNALQLGRSTQYTASEVTSLQTELAKLGFTEPQILAMTESTLNFASAVGTDLPSAASMAGATLRMFGLPASQAEETLGVLAVATNKSALNFSYLESAMSTVGPVASTFGFTVRDTTALLGILANSGFDASSAATATRNILLNLADSSGKLAQALGKPVKTFPELMEGLKTLNERGVDLATTLELTDKRSVSAFNAFLRGADDAVALRDSLEDVNGELGRIADERMNTVEGSIKKLKSAWEGFTLAFSNSKGVIKSVLDFVTKTVNSITDIIGDQTPRLGRKMLDSLREIEGDDDDAIRERLVGYISSTKNQITEIADRIDEAGDKEAKRLKKSLSERQKDLAVYLSALSLLGAAEEASPTLSNTGTGNSSSGSSGGSGGNKDSKKTWSLQNDETFLAARKALYSKYNEGEIKSKEALEEELYKLEISSLTARLAANKEKGADRIKLEEQLQDKIHEHKAKAEEKEKKLREEAAQFLVSLENDKEKAAELAEDIRYRKEKEQFDKIRHLYEDSDKVLQTIEQNHQNKIAKIRLDAANRNLAELQQKLKAKEASIRATYAENSSSIPSGGWKDSRLAEKMNKEILAAQKDSLDNQLEGFKALVNSGLTQGTLSDEDLAAYNLTIAQLQQQIAEVLKQIKGEDLGPFQGSGGSMFGVSESQWSLLFQHLKDGKMQAQDMMSLLNSVGGAAQVGFELASKSIEVTSAKEKKAYDDWVEQTEKKKRILQDSLDSGLITQAQHDARLEAMQKEQEKKQQDLELSKAKREKTLAIVQSIIQTSLSVLKTFTQFGGWPGGVVPAAIMGGIGTAQTALIKAQPVGYAEGGLVTRQQDGRIFRAVSDPRRRGYVRRASILVGEEGGEYVIPAAGLRNPTLAPVVSAIESARLAGTLRSLDFRAVYPPAALSGIAGGGFTQGGASVNPLGTSSGTAAALLGAITRLNERLDAGIEASVRLLGRGGLKEAEENYERMKNRGRL